MNHKRLGAIIATTALAVGGLGVGVAVAATDHSSPALTQGGVDGQGPMQSYYHSMMGGYGGSPMMGGGDGSGTGSVSYGWMMGGVAAPGWMHGGNLPGYMVHSGTDPGKVMGRLFANAPGPRLSAAVAKQLGSAVPWGARVYRGANSLSFSRNSATFVALASPPGGPDETYRIAGMVNPTVTVKSGTRVTIEVINADPDTAHGLVVTRTGTTSSWMPMTTSPLAFRGAAVWFLGNPTSAGLHTGTLQFTAGTAGTYQYLCAVPGHAQKGMVATFIVRS
jgi:rusticyanin